MLLEKTYAFSVLMLGKCFPICLLRFTNHCICFVHYLSYHIVLECVSINEKSCWAVCWWCLRRHIELTGIGLPLESALQFWAGTLWFWGHYRSFNQGQCIIGDMPKLREVWRSSLYIRIIAIQSWKQKELLLRFWLHFVLCLYLHFIYSFLLNFFQSLCLLLKLRYLDSELFDLLE